MINMKFAPRSIKKVGSTLVAAAIGLAAAVAPLSAMADTLGWVRVTGNELRLITPSGTIYYAYTAYAPTGCFTVPADTFKEWQSMAQAALLAGKTVGVAYTSCGSPAVNVINHLELTQ